MKLTVAFLQTLVLACLFTDPRVAAARGTAVETSSQAAAQPVTVDDVIKMVEAKLGDDIVIAQIRRSGTSKALTPDDLIRLKGKGVSDDVIRAMTPTADTPIRTESRATSTGNVPTVEQARAVLAGNIRGPMAQQLRLTEFTKLDGQHIQFGVQAYKLEFAASITAERDILLSVNGNVINAAPAGTTLNDGSGFSWDAWMNTAVQGRRPLRANDSVRMNGNVTFELKESGWAVSTMSFKLLPPPAGAVAPASGVSGGGTGARADTPAPSTSSSSDAAISAATAGDQDTAAFPVLRQTIRKPKAAVWDRIHAVFALNKDPIEHEDSGTGVIVTRLTRHGSFPVARLDRFCVVVTSIDGESTEVAVKALLYSPVVGGNRMNARPADRVAQQSLKLLEDFAK